MWHVTPLVAEHALVACSAMEVCIRNCQHSTCQTQAHQSANGHLMLAQCDKAYQSVRMSSTHPGALIDVSEGHLHECTEKYTLLNNPAHPLLRRHHQQQFMGALLTGSV
ncbi:hypothetical protein SARC_08400 [Sphaeroforma arctica JP610]|uniref:Uncharacterized protein n=1 Tax=Sphaeroforma arctica JP610 TaxID=667725 RepID=A0A0L0FRL4_9EUKA|nr:hypothetical protein SARC_08400 [Sphaeroforma arctica JP610]KNC79201.1 hypothetical protein SARC_08400 [Sphaeroforma arctica JP610]|eukprot:XP_014153103.1 hypothetical protein SARC_08400 [Sphaeroforma arctica JP610]